MGWVLLFAALAAATAAASDLPLAVNGTCPADHKCGCCFSTMCLALKPCTGCGASPTRPGCDLCVCWNNTALADDLNAFDRWQLEYGRKAAYNLMDPTELQTRRDTFNNNLQMIAAHNARATHILSSYTLAMNAFGDLTLPQFRALHGTRSTPRASAAATPSVDWLSGAHSDPPASYDWRSKGAVSPIKNQFEPHSCGR